MSIINFPTKAALNRYLQNYRAPSSLDLRVGPSVESGGAITASEKANKSNNPHDHFTAFRENKDASSRHRMKALELLAQGQKEEAQIHRFLSNYHDSLAQEHADKSGEVFDEWAERDMMASLSRAWGPTISEQHEISKSASEQGKTRPKS